jgi:hypothetical protein
MHASSICARARLRARAGLRCCTGGVLYAVTYSCEPAFVNALLICRAAPRHLPDLLSPPFPWRTPCIVSVPHRQYLLKAYRRARVFKIEQMHMFLLADEDAFNCMSEAEHNFCKGFANLCQRHFESSACELCPCLCKG